MGERSAINELQAAREAYRNAARASDRAAWKKAAQRLAAAREAYDKEQFHA